MVEHDVEKGEEWFRASVQSSDSDQASEPCFGARDPLRSNAHLVEGDQAREFLTLIISFVRFLQSIAANIFTLRISH